jgi:hypothetical protein
MARSRLMLAGTALAASALVSSALVSSAVPAAAQEKAATRPGFAFPADHPIRILVLRPEVRAGAQSAGGTVSPNADWTRAARRNIGGALVAARPGGAADMVFMPDAEGEAAAVLADYRALFGAVADTVLQHRLFKGDRLPTKKTGFEYTLGPGVARLAAGTGGDYALFVATNDAYGSTGRKLLQAAALLAVAASGVGASVTAGEHNGYAGLTDLKTGDLVWMNADARMGGDVRDAAGAAKRVAQLLEDFPAQQRTVR